MSDEPKTTSVLFESERAEMDRLHLAIWKSVHRIKGVTHGRNAGAHVYHPANLLSRLQQLENMVGCLTALLISPGRYHVIPHVDTKLLFAQMAETYEAQLADLELNAMAHNAAYQPVNLDPRVKVGKPDAEEE
jgi:hypothetical protein